MTTTVRLPDGSEVDVATDDPKQAAAAAQKHWATKQAAGPKAPSAPKAAQAPVAPQRTWRDTANGLLGDAVDGILPNFGDEIFATGAAAAAALMGKPISKSFREAQDYYKGNKAQTDAENPKLAMAAKVGGMGIGLAAPVGRLATGASGGARLAHTAAVGAGYGAVSGAGEGDTWSDRASHALTSG